MKALFLLPFLLLPVPPLQNGSGPDDGSAVAILGFKWSKSRQVIEKHDNAGTAPAPAMISANKNFERNRRINDPAGVRDPNADTLDGRSAALEKNVQDARTPKLKPVDGFTYSAKIKNAGTKVVEIVFWEYQFQESSNPGAVTRRQFLCGVNIKPGKEKELVAFSLSGPSDVISVESLANKSQNLFQEKVIINRVEYADGTIWQRKGWNFSEIRLTYQQAVGTPWGAEMCRGL